MYLERPFDHVIIGGWASPWRIGERHGLQGCRGSNPDGIPGFSSSYSPSDAFP